MASAARVLARGLLVQHQVVHALVLRETRTRFGSHQLGYFWALANPVMFVGTFAVMLHITGRGAPLGMDVNSFLATGFLTFFFFRDVANRGSGAVKANKGLLFYPQVHPLDLIAARTQLEITTLAVVFVLVMGGNALWQQQFNIDDPLLVVVGLALAAGIGASLGLVLCAIAVFSNSVERISGFALRPLFWVSGLFFTANDLPPQARDVLLYNPLLHCIELVRTGWFPAYDSRYADWAYPAIWAVGLAFVGLTLERVARQHVEVT